MMILMGTGESFIIIIIVLFYGQFRLVLDLSINLVIRQANPNPNQPSTTTTTTSTKGKRIILIGHEQQSEHTGHSKRVQKSIFVIQLPFGSHRQTVLVVQGR